MSIAPSAAERAELLELVDALRERGAVRVTYGALCADFAGPRSEPGEKQAPTEPLTRAERERLAELEERYQFDEELGNRG